MPKIDLLDQNVMNQIVTELENSEERARKKHSFDNWQVYSGNQDPYVEEVLKVRRPKSHQAYTISNISISKMVTDKKSKSYKQQPVRFVERDNKTKNERLEAIYKEGNANRQLPYFDTSFNLHKHSLMWVNYMIDGDMAKYNFMALQPHEYSVIRDKTTGKLLAVILNYSHRDITAGSNSGDGIDGLLAESQADSAGESKIYRMWSDDNYVVVKVEENEIITAEGAMIQKSVTYLTNPENPNNDNVIGKLPFAYASQELAIDYPTPNPIGEQSVTFGSLMSELLTSANIQGTSTLVFKYPSKMQGKFDNISVGLKDAIELPQSEKEGAPATEVDYISPNPDLAGQKDSYMTYLEGVLSQHGISVGQAMGNDVEASASGIALAIKNANVQDIIEQNQNVFVQLEKEMFEIIKAWENFIGGSLFSDDDELNIVFKKPKVLISDKEVLDNIKMRIDMGLMEQYEALMELDPNLTEKQAKDKIQEIKDAKKQNMTEVLGGFGVQETNENIGTQSIQGAGTRTQ